MEIERKWLTDGWPQGLEEQRRILMRQGYITTRPTVRIRSEASGDVTEYVLCFKGAAGPDGLAREEIETNIDPELFAKLEAFVGRPLIEKEQRRYALPGGLTLEVNQVDRGQPGEFFYAEVEFPTKEAALAWQPGELGEYLSDEVTGKPGQSMAAYWTETRGEL
jgi:adenylate cyclase